MSRLGLRFYLVVTLVGFGLIWASGIYLALIGYRGNPAECGSACLEGVVPGGVGFLLVLTCGHRALRLFIAGPGHVTVKRAESTEIGSGPEDEGILAIANELLSQRRIGRRTRSVQILAWSDRQSWHYASFRQQGFRKPPRLTISSSLRHKLDLEDWRTLLTYSFLQNNPRRKAFILRPFATGILLPVILLIVIGATLSFTLGQYWAELFGAVAGPLVLLLFSLFIGPAFREMWLRTDTVVALSLGNLKLLNLFEKIDSLQLSENENAKKREGWAARLWPMPNITQRIANLQSTATP